MLVARCPPSPLRPRARGSLTFQPARCVLQKHTPVPHQLLPLQVLLGKHLAALHPHDRLAVCLGVNLIETYFLFVTRHLAVHSPDHILHQTQGLCQVILLRAIVLEGKRDVFNGSPPTEKGRHCPPAGVLSGQSQHLGGHKFYSKPCEMFSVIQFTCDHMLCSQGEGTKHV